MLTHAVKSLRTLSLLYYTNSEQKIYFYLRPTNIYKILRSASTSSLPILFLKLKQRICFGWTEHIHHVISIFIRYCSFITARVCARNDVGRWKMCWFLLRPSFSDCMLYQAACLVKCSIENDHQSLSFIKHSTNTVFCTVGTNRSHFHHFFLFLSHHIFTIFSFFIPKFLSFFRNFCHFFC